MHPRQLSHLLFLLPLLILPSLSQPQDLLQDEQQQQFTQYSQHLAQFVPSQSFQFQLMPGEQQTFIYWPSIQVSKMRGMFYITSEENQGLFLGVEHQGAIQKSFWDKKIGVFSVGYRGGDMKIIAKSELKHIKVYISYQFVTKQKQKKSQQPQPQQSPSPSPSPSSSPQSQLSPILQKFSTISSSLSTQQTVLKSIIQSTIFQAQRLQSQINGKTFRIGVETVVLVLSGFASLFMIRREVRRGYEIIV